MNRLIWAAALITCLASADTLTLRNGRTVFGSYLGGDSRQIRMVVGEKVETFAIADVVKLEFGSLMNPPEIGPAATAQQPDSRALRADRAPGVGGPAALREIPAGTTIAVRMIDPVDSRNDKLGQTYRASLDEPLMIEGQVIIQRGADVMAKLVDEKESGRATGQTVLTLDLESITVDGRVIPLATEEVTRASASTTRRTGIAAGGLAAIGAVIGGIAGGGRGAAIGAASGAGAGAATSVMMKGEQVRIPSETRLTFTLQQPLRL
jgi:hypothetical protein